MRAAVIGAGIGGLCTAVGLQRAGAEVTVHERAADLRPGGSGLSVFGNGLRALDSLGLGDGFREITSADAGLLRGGQRRPDGRWLATIPAESLTSLRVVDRAQLHELLASALAPGSLRPGRRVIAATAEGRVTHAGADGAADEDVFDLVVAADGLHSVARRSLPEDPGIRYSGYSTWRGITDGPVDLHGEAGETWGVGRRFGIAPLADGRVYWFAVLSVPRAERVGDDAAALRRLFGAWHAPIPELIAARAPSRIQYLPIDERAGRLPSYVHGRLALVGDAAHAMTPNLGQGGGQAMEDAATLAALLAPLASPPSTGGAELSAALSRYDALRRPRSQAIAARSRAVGRLAHVRGRALAGLRDVVIRATPAAALRRQLDSIQSWSPPA
jgi:2-polyprenyl-6-methoxyphenol hydroxylase-like FAD-dependent oxidoreductase